MEFGVSPRPSPYSGAAILERPAPHLVAAVGQQLAVGTPLPLGGVRGLRVFRVEAGLSEGGGGGGAGTLPVQSCFVRNMDLQTQESSEYREHRSVPPLGRSQAGH